MKIKKIVAETNGDQYSSTYKNNYWNNCITELRDCQNFFKQRQIESFDMLAKTLAQGTLADLEKTMAEYTWLNDADRHYIWKAISNEITAMIFKKRLEVGCEND